MELHADGKPAYNEVRPGSPRGSLRHYYLYPSAMQPSAQYLPPLASMCCGNPLQGISSTTLTASHMTQGRAEYESTVPWGTDEGLDLWEVNPASDHHSLMRKIKVLLHSHFEILFCNNEISDNYLHVGAKKVWNVTETQVIQSHSQTTENQLLVLLSVATISTGRDFCWVVNIT